MFQMHDEDVFFEEYKKIAYKIASRFLIENYADIEKEDIEQLALIYLWEATKSYDEKRGASFSTYAHIYIYSKLTNDFQKANSLKNRANINRADLANLTEDGKDGYDTILESPPDENSIAYQNLKLDIEMQLQKLKKRARNTRGQSLSKGIHIIECLMDGETPLEIRKEMGMNEGVYKQCLYHARSALKACMEA